MPKNTRGALPKSNSLGMFFAHITLINGLKRFWYGKGLFNEDSKAIYLGRSI